MTRHERNERAAERRAREAVGYAKGRREAYYRAVRAKNGAVITRRRDEWERAVKRAEYLVREHRAACNDTDAAAAAATTRARLASAAGPLVAAFVAMVPSITALVGFMA